MNGERDFDGIRVDGVPLADVLKDQRDNRTIMVRDREVAVQMKSKKKHPVGKFIYAPHQKMYQKDMKPGKGRYLSRKELEEAKMEKDIKKINTEGLTLVESIYVAFRENGWASMKSIELAHAVGSIQTSISSIVSKMTKDGMMTRAELKPNRYYYQISDECKGLGRIGWANMYREMDSRLKKEKKSKPTKKKAKKAKVVGNQPVLKSDSNYEKLANKIHRLVENLSVAVQAAERMGLKVDLEITKDNCHSRVYKEF